jgi:hypothetical protein
MHLSILLRTASDDNKRMCCITSLPPRHLLRPIKLPTLSLSLSLNTKHRMSIHGGTNALLNHCSIDSIKNTVNFTQIHIHPFLPPPLPLRSSRVFQSCTHTHTHTHINNSALKRYLLKIGVSLGQDHNGYPVPPHVYSLPQQTRSNVLADICGCCASVFFHLTQLTQLFTSLLFNRADTTEQSYVLGRKYSI